jgi:hypothetical protein
MAGSNLKGGAPADALPHRVSDSARAGSGSYTAPIALADFSALAYRTSAFFS